MNYNHEKTIISCLPFHLRWQWLLFVKKQKKSVLVVMKDGKIVEIKPGEVQFHARQEQKKIVNLKQVGWLMF
jgi:imidazolonepropionase-like amidohydrolase